MPDHPEILYKYRSINEYTLTSLINRTVYIPLPRELNDPFDCKPSLTLESIPIEEYKRIAFAGFSRTSKKRAGKIVFNQSSFDKIYYKGSYTKNVKRDVMFISEDFEKLSSETGVFSLSQTNDNTTMWSHYADSHKGICIGYRIKKFHVNNIAPYLVQVEYKPQEHLFVNAWRLFASSGGGADGEVWQQEMEKYLSMKVDDWKYEKEWRIFYPQRQNNSHHINKEAIAEIIFGVNSSLQTKLALRNIFAERDVVFKQMVKEENYSGLRCETMEGDSKHWGAIGLSSIVDDPDSAGVDCQLSSGE